MKDNLYTSNALQGNRVAAAFRAAFSTKKVGDSGVDISEPEESTHKGALALQHITLKSPTGLGLVVGSVNAVTRVAELRPFAAVARMHQDRFKHPPGFDAAAYATFVDDVTTMLDDQGIRVTVGAAEIEDDEAPRAGAPAGDRGAAAPQASTRNAVFVALAIGAAVGAAAMWLSR